MGRLAQLGERGVRNAEVTGSIPVPSTIGEQLSRKPHIMRPDAPDGLPIGPRVGLAVGFPVLLTALFFPGAAPGLPATRAAAPAQADADAERRARVLIERVEAHHRSLPHFEARFEQRFSPRIFGRERIETGRLTVKQPGRMRWDYEVPEPKVFVSDGTNTWFHVPADQQVVVGSFGNTVDGGNETPFGDEGPAVNPLDFLTGNAAILDHFDAFVGGPGAPGFRAVSLIPRQPGGEIQSLELTVDTGSGRIHAIESEDPEGNRTTFEFTDFRSDTTPADSLFTFTIPPGTEVVTASALRP